MESRTAPNWFDTFFRADSTPQVRRWVGVANSLSLADASAAFMKTKMDKDLHHQAIQRVLALGRGSDPDALPELISLTRHPSSEVRRLAASAIGKLAAFGANATDAVAALGVLALEEPLPQVRQYALKGLKLFGSAAQKFLRDLDDLAARSCNRKASA